MDLFTSYVSSNSGAIGSEKTKKSENVNSIMKYFYVNNSLYNDKVLSKNRQRILSTASSYNKYEKLIVTAVYAFITGGENKDKIYYDDKKREYMCDNDECVIDKLVKEMGNRPYDLYHNDLVKEMVYSFVKAPKYFEEDEWFGDDRLDLYGHSFNLIMYQPFDHENIFTVKRDPLPIDQDVKISHGRFNKFVTRALRTLIVRYAIYPKEIREKLKLTHTESNVSVINDTIYQRYPFCYGGTVACDWYLVNKSGYATIEDISIYLDRYPSLMIGFIVNTDRYGSSGEHWVALMFCRVNGIKCAQLICSFGNSFKIFKDNGMMVDELKRCGFKMNYNHKVIQTDDSNCGLYSTMSLIMLIEYEGDIERSVEAIGVNACNLNRNGIGYIRNVI